MLSYVPLVDTTTVVLIEQAVRQKVAERGWRRSTELRCKKTYGKLKKKNHGNSLQYTVLKVEV